MVYFNRWSVYEIKKFIAVLKINSALIIHPDDRASTVNLFWDSFLWIPIKDETENRTWNRISLTQGPLDLSKTRFCFLWIPKKCHHVQKAGYKSVQNVRIRLLTVHYGYDYVATISAKLGIFVELSRSFLLNFQTILMLFVNDCPTEVAENRKSLNINMEHIFQMWHIWYVKYPLVNVTFSTWTRRQVLEQLSNRAALGCFAIATRLPQALENWSLFDVHGTLSCENIDFVTTNSIIKLIQFASWL